MSVVLVVRARQPPSSTRLKGAPFALDVVVRRRGGERVEPLVPGETLHEGDALRFRVRAPRSGYLAVLDRDGSGKVSPFAPHDTAVTPIPEAGERALDGSVVLDGTLGDERLIAVLCPSPDEAARSIEAVAKMTDLPADCLQTAISFSKRSLP
jgi:hypothetical protein